jgi:chromosome segregation ATPase
VGDLKATVNRLETAGSSSEDAVAAAKQELEAAVLAQQSAAAERDSAVAEREAAVEQMRKVESELTASTEESTQLQAQVDAAAAEKQQVGQLQARVEQLQTEMESCRAQFEADKAELVQSVKVSAEADLEKSQGDALGKFELDMARLQSEKEAELKAKDDIVQAVTHRLARANTEHLEAVSAIELKHKQDIAAVQAKLEESEARELEITVAHTSALDSAEQEKVEAVKRAKEKMRPKGLREHQARAC